MSGTRNFQCMDQDLSLINERDKMSEKFIYGVTILNTSDATPIPASINPTCDAQKPLNSTILRNL